LFGFSIGFSQFHKRVRDGTRDKPVIDGHGFSSDNDDPQEEQESSIATSRQIRQIRLSQRYGYTDLLAMHLLWQRKLGLRSLPLIQKLSQVMSNGLLP